MLLLLAPEARPFSDGLLITPMMPLSDKIPADAADDAEASVKHL